MLLAREWVPIPDGALRRNSSGSALTWSAQFNSSVIEKALAMGAAPVLVHSHGTPQPTFSKDDQDQRADAVRCGQPTGVSRTDRDSATRRTARLTGSFWLKGRNSMSFRRLVILGDTIETWVRVGYRPAVRLRAAA